jgi:hypothetical protein
VRNEYIEELVAAVPEVVVINSCADVVGRMSSKKLETAYNWSPLEGYVKIRQWALDRKFTML